MSMTKILDRSVLLAFTLIGVLCLVSPCHAQDPGKTQDDALDSLIEKLGGPTPNDQAADDQDKPDKDQDAAKPAKPDAEKPSAESKPGEVSAEDKAVDDFLEKLGATKDEPTPEDRPKQPGAGGDKPPGEPSKGGAGDGKGQRQELGLGEKDRQLDEQLEELSGRKRKRNQSNSREQEGSGPMGQIVKEMREIEKRLGQPDTGDDTRGKQKEIVKQLDTLIEQIRKSKSQPGQGMKQVRQAGQKPGDQPGEEAGTNPGGAPLTRPTKPTNQQARADGKDEWGHLPPELRQEMENVFKEDALPIYQELIRRYYLSVSRGKLNRGE